MKTLRKSEIPKSLPPSITVWVNTGFQGLDKETQADVEMPKKKSKNKPLTVNEKENNKRIKNSK